MKVKYGLSIASILEEKKCFITKLAIFLKRWLEDQLIMNLVLSEEYTHIAMSQHNLWYMLHEYALIHGFTPLHICQLYPNSATGCNNISNKQNEFQ